MQPSARLLTWMGDRLLAERFRASEVTLRCRSRHYDGGGLNIPSPEPIKSYFVSDTSLSTFSASVKYIHP